MMAVTRWAIASRADSASSPFSPVRTRVTPATGIDQIFPSPIEPVCAAAAISCITASAWSDGTSTSMRSFGM